MLPSAEDEVNVACFHPFAGGGLVYGTKVCFRKFWENRWLFSVLMLLNCCFAVECRKGSLGFYSVMVVVV